MHSPTQYGRTGFVARALAVLATVLLSPAAARPDGGRLVLADRVKMLTCEASTAPCFRLRLNVTDTHGGPIAVALAPDSQLANNITVALGDEEVTPFFASAVGQVQAKAPSRTVLFLIDISGSMNKPLAGGETRFAAAKEALAEYIQGFQDGDRIAVAPFQSRGVEQGISAAAFGTSRDGVQRQINSLPAPEPRNNTALFSAFDLGLDKLESLQQGSPDSEFQLYVLTDGENDVGHRGDDPGLLAGDEGRKRVEDKVRAYSHIQVNAVGFGDPREIDELALKEITNRYHMFTDAAGLKEFFRPPAPPPPSSKALQVAFKSPWSDRAALQGRILHLRVLLHLPGGATLSSNDIDITWTAPHVGQPLYEGKCDTAEGTALLNASSSIAPVAWLSILRPVAVFAFLAAALLVLWFAVPRLVWPEGFKGKFEAQQPARWSPPTIAMPQAAPAARKPAPPGFQPQTESAGVPQRAPAEATRVMHVDRMGTRTRLELRKVAKEERQL